MVEVIISDQYHCFVFVEWQTQKKGGILVA